MPIYPNTTLLITNGNTGSTITSNSITTPSLITSSINVSTAGSTGKILSTNGSTLTWVTPSVSVNGSTDLNMNNNDIINVNTLTCTNLNATTVNTTTFVNQTTFNNPPISIYPTNSNHIATKEYTDNSTLQKKYKLVLYFNISQLVLTDIYTLNTNMTNNSTTQILYTSTGAFSNILLGNFITIVPLNTQIPECLCKFIGYFICSSSNVFVYYTICKYSSSGVSTVLKRSNTYVINNVNSSRLIHMYTRLPITTTILTGSDKLQILLYTTSPNTAATTITFVSESNLYSYFELESNSVLNLFRIYNNVNLNNYTIGKTGSSLTIDTQFNNESITLGPATNITINGTTGGNINLTPSNNIQIYKPLYPLYNLPISSTNIGYTTTITSLTPITLLNGGTSNTIYTFTIPYAGVTLYSITVAMNITTPSTIIGDFISCELYTSVNVTIGGQRQNLQNKNNKTGIRNVINFSAIDITTNTTSSYKIVFRFNHQGGLVASSTSTNFRLQYCRIA